MSCKPALINDFPILEDLCGLKKMKSHFKNGSILTKTHFLYFHSKTKYESSFSQVFGFFFTYLVRFLQYLKTGNIEGNFVFTLFKSSSYEHSLKKRWNFIQTQFSLKNNILKHIFSIFLIFTYLGRFSKHIMYVHWNDCIF